MDNNNNKKASNTDDILKIIEEYRQKSDKISAEKKADDAASVPDGEKEAPKQEPKKEGSPVAQPQKEEAVSESAGDEANDDDVKVVEEKPMPETEESPSVSEDALSNHFSDKPDLEKYKAEKEKHFAESEEAKAKKKEKKKFSFKRLITKIGNMSFLLKSVIYLAFVLVAAIYCSYYAVTGINDVFALVNTEAEAKITVTEATTVDDITKELKAQGVIKYPWLFKLYCNIYGDGTDIKLLPGEYVISDELNFSTIIARLTTVHIERKEVRVTIPEGFTVDQIIDLLVSKGIGTREGYVEAINHYPYKHEFVVMLDEMGYSEDRLYRLEGYLFPDTYDFYTDTKEYLVINRLLNAFQTRFWEYYDSDYKAAIEAHGMTFDDIITLASLVQMEAKYITDYECISYVFHNRLSHPNTHPYLESDATIQYFLDARKEDLTQDDLNTDNPYNSYLYKGLTPGAICCPGLDAIEAAIFPAPPVNTNGYEIDAYFFVSDVTGKTYYAKTDAGHEANKKIVEEVNKQYDEQE